MVMEEQEIMKFQFMLTMLKYGQIIRIMPQLVTVDTILTQGQTITICVLINTLTWSLRSMTGIVMIITVVILIGTGAMVPIYGWTLLATWLRSHMMFK